MNSWDFFTETITRPHFTLRTPLLWVSSDAVCFGTGAVVADVRAEHVAWLRSADGTRTCREFIAARPHLVHVPGDADEEVAVPLVRAAMAAGVIDDAAFTTHHWRWGDDRQRRECSRLNPLIRHQWASAGFSPLDLNAAVAHAIDLRMSAAVAIDPCEPLLLPITSALAAVGIRVVSPHDDHALMIGVARGHPALFSEPDYSPLTGKGDPHTHVPYLHVGLGTGAGTSGGQVGPLVVPGTTACLRCAHLHERDRDPTWPLRAVQWTEHARRSRASLQPPLGMDPMVELHVVGLISHIVRMWVDDGAIDTTDHWADVVHHTDGLTQRRIRVTSHPQCGCDWQWAAA